MKKIISILLIIFIIVNLLTGCTKKYEKFTHYIFDTFDTVTQIVGYTHTKKEFDEYANYIDMRLLELHKYYDKYNNYEGVNNIKTINDNAGIRPVKVDKEIIDLIKFSKNMYEKTGILKTNIAYGAVINIWSAYRDEAEVNPENARIPTIEELERASKHTDINKVILDEENSTVYLEDPQMSLDVGAVAKGYATELVTNEVIAKGFKSGIISAGGNIRTIGKPLDGIRERWGIGIQHPDKSVVNDQSNILDTVYINDASVVSSGDYQRFYIVDGKVYHHLIDPATLMPGDYYRAVTVITPDSGEADFLSTTVFLLPYEEGRQLVESLDNVEALWIFKDGRIEFTEGMKKIMNSQGASGATAE